VGAAYGQPAVTPRFEVASIKPSNVDTASSSGIKTAHGRLDGYNVTLKRCIMGAYSVGPQQISGGPDWLESDRYEILAKADQPINDDAVMMVMLQGLLAERFKLVLHRETRTIPALVLEVARNGPKLEKAGDGEAVTNTSTSKTGVHIDARNTDIDLFARILARKTDQPVVNHTGLKGIFNIQLHWTPESATPPAGGAMEEASLFTAIQEQLGLRLRSQKAPVEVLVIDHAEKPSGN
jgi:uncharacterized protein (TIGR03435 family)